MSQELELVDQYTADFEKVVNLLIKGELNPTNISKITGIKRALVVEYISNWKGIAQNDRGVKARAREALTEMDRHFSLIIKELWAIVDDPSVNAGTKATSLKTIADVEAKRQDVLQKTGQYDDIGIADELVAMEEKAEAIKRLLSEVARRWPETMPFIMEGIQNAFNESPVVEGDIVGS